jgi:hypothetical protein
VWSAATGQAWVDGSEECRKEKDAWWTRSRGRLGGLKEQQNVHGYRERHVTPAEAMRLIVGGNDTHSAAWSAWLVERAVAPAAAGCWWTLTCLPAHRLLVDSDLPARPQAAGGL